MSVPSFVRSVASGLTRVFSIPFPYLSRSHTYVFVGSGLVPPSGYTWLNDGEIELVVTPASGEVVSRHRFTPQDPLTVFAPGNLSSKDLNLSKLQDLYLAQEAFDLSNDSRLRAWVTENYGPAGSIVKGGAGQLAKFTAEGNLVPGPNAVDAAHVDEVYQLILNIANNPNRAPRPQDFAGASDNAKIVTCAQYAQANTGVMEFSGTYTNTGDITLPGGVHYKGVGGNAIIDGSGRSDALASSFLRGAFKVQGSIEGGLSLATSIGPTQAVSWASCTRSGTTATITTVSPHGLTTGDYAWHIYGAGYPSLGAGGLFFLSQGQATEQMHLTAPFLVSVVSPTVYVVYVDSGAPSSFSPLSISTYKNHLMVKTVSAHGYSAGDWVEVSSNRTLPAVSGYQPIPLAELAQVSRVLDANTVILSASLTYQYYVSDGAKVRRVTLPDGAISDLTFKGRGSTNTPNLNDGDNGFSLDLVGDWTLDRVASNQCELFSFSFHRFRSIVANNLKSFARFTDDAGRTNSAHETKLPYGIAWGSWFQKLQLNSPVIMGNHRHGIAGATESAIAGISGALEINNPTIIGSLSNCIATHFDNFGMRVMGGFLSGHSYGLDARYGNVLVDGTRGSGGEGLLNFYGRCSDIVVRNVYGESYASAMVKFVPSEGPLFVPAQLDVDGVRCYGALFAVYALSLNTYQPMDVRVRNVHAVGVQYNSVLIQSPSGQKGRSNVNGVTGNSVGIAQGASSIPVSVSNQTFTQVDNVDVPPSAGQTAYGYSFSGVDKFALGEGIIRDVSAYEVYTIVSGKITIKRIDDHACAVRGEGSVADNLDEIVGISEGQRILLSRYAETITFRDRSVSGLSLGQGVIETPGGTNITVGDYNDFVEIQGVSNGGTLAYAVVTSSGLA